MCDLAMEIQTHCIVNANKTTELAQKTRRSDN